MEDKIVAILSDLQTAVVGVAPDIWAALVLAARVDSALSLAFSIMVVLTTFVALRKTGAMFEWLDTHDEIWGFAFFLTGGALVVLVVIALIVLFSTSTWLGLFYPEAIVIRSLLSNITG